MVQAVVMSALNGAPVIEDVTLPDLGDSDVRVSVAELITNDYLNGNVFRVDGGIRMPPR